jgi:hypothetical protein
VLFNECGDSLCEHINKRRRRYERERCCSMSVVTHCVNTLIRGGVGMKEKGVVH